MGRELVHDIDQMAEVSAEPFSVSHYGFFVSAAPPSLDTAYWAVAD